MPKTGQELLDDLQADLDEVTYQNWTPTQLLRYINKGISQVCSALRNERRHYLDKVMLSTDASTTLMGQTYNPTSLKCVSGATTITLPPDCLEVVTLLPVSQDLLDRQVQFVPESPTSSAYINAKRSGTIESATVYYYHVRGKTTLEVATPFSETFEVRLQYSAVESPIESTDQVTLLPDWIVDVAVLYAQYRALYAIKHPDYGAAFQAYQTELTNLIQLSKPRHSQTVETVEGIFDVQDNNLSIVNGLW